MFEWLEKNRWWLTFSLVGLILLLLGLFFLFLSQEKEPEIQIISSQESERNLIFIHLEGAIQKPGVYEIPEGSRLNDLLILADGLSAKADREWITQNLNLAQKLTDGAKIIIPAKGEIQGLTSSVGLNLSKKINLNQASLSQLDFLEGIGAKRAQDIINGRPYQVVEELKTRKIIPESIFEKIQDEITAY